MVADAFCISASKSFACSDQSSTSINLSDLSGDALQSSIPLKAPKVSDRASSLLVSPPPKQVTPVTSSPPPPTLKKTLKLSCSTPKVDSELFKKCMIFGKKQGNVSKGSREHYHKACNLEAYKLVLEKPELLNNRHKLTKEAQGIISGSKKFPCKRGSFLS